MKIIDFEAHAQDLLTGNFQGGKLQASKALSDFAEERLALMDFCGCTTQVLSYHANPLFDPVYGMDKLMQLNNSSYHLSKMYPGRFKGYAVVPINNHEAAFAELERCKEELGLVGWFVHSNYNGRAIDEDDLLPLIDKVAALGMHIYLHPAPPIWERFSGLGPILSDAYGYHVDPALTLLRLILKGVFDKNPDLKIILGHYGEGLPFMIDRLDSMHLRDEQTPAVNEYPICYYFEKNVWVTTSGNFSKAAFNCTKDRLGIEHMMFGSDCPIESLRETVNFVNGACMTQVERERLFYKNAEEFFGVS